MGSMLCLGLLGERVARLFQPSQKRPQFLTGYDSLEDRGPRHVELDEPGHRSEPQTARSRT